MHVMDWLVILALASLIFAISTAVWDPFKWLSKPFKWLRN